MFETCVNSCSTRVNSLSTRVNSFVNSCCRELNFRCFQGTFYQSPIEDIADRQSFYLFNFALLITDSLNQV